MTGIEIISRHITLPDEWQKLVTPCNAVCAFTNKSITEGVKLKDLIGQNFTDYAYMPYASNFASVEATKCIVPVIKAEKGYNSLRNYSFIANSDFLRVLPREEIMQYLLVPIQPPFVFCVSYSCKKHLSYKADVNYKYDNFIVQTDNEKVIIKQDTLREILPIMQSWYSMIEGKEDTEAQPTIFQKNTILTGQANAKSIQEYGVERFLEENAILEKYRNTALMRLLFHSLTKTIKNHVTS